MTLSGNRSRPVIFLTGGLLLAGLALGCGGAPVAPEVTPPAPVKWMEARQFFLEEWTEMLGTTQPLPDQIGRVTAAVEGKVAAILVDGDLAGFGASAVGLMGSPAGGLVASGLFPGKTKSLTEGQHVFRGQVIVQLDDRVLKANLARAVATQEKLDIQKELAANAVDQANVEVNRIKQSLADKLTVPKSDQEKARLALREANIKLQSAEAERQTGLRDIQALQAQMRLYSLRAPIQGKLGKIEVALGQTLAVGTRVTEVINISQWIDVLCFVPPRVAKRLKRGQPARIGGIGEPQPATTVGALGKVAFIADVAELDTGNFAVKVRFPNQNLRMRANTTVRLRVQTDPGKACLALEEKAVFVDKDPPAVIVVEEYQEKDKKGKETTVFKARELRVKLGLRDREKKLLEIVSLDDPEKKWKGTLETAKFVVERGQGIRTGDAIKLEVEEEEE